VRTKNVTVIFLLMALVTLLGGHSAVMASQGDNPWGVVSIKGGDNYDGRITVYHQDVGVVGSGLGAQLKVLPHFFLSLEISRNNWVAFSGTADSTMSILDWDAQRDALHSFLQNTVLPALTDDPLAQIYLTDVLDQTANISDDDALLFIDAVVEVTVK